MASMSRNELERKEKLQRYLISRSVLHKRLSRIVDVRFWHGVKENEMTSSERVFSMKSFTSPSGTTLMFRLSSSDSILGAEIVFRVAEFNFLSGFWPIMPSIRPRMKEYSKGIVFVSSRQLIFIYKSSQSEFICKS